MGRGAPGGMRVLSHFSFKWLQVLGCAEPPHIDQRVGHQFHPVVSTLEVRKTQQQPLEFVLPCERPLDALPYGMDRLIEEPLTPSLRRLAVALVLFDVRYHPSIEDRLAIR